MRSAKKIFIVATDVPSLRGGAPVRNLNLIQQYLNHGLDVTVICLHDNTTRDELARLKSLVGLKVIGVELGKQSASLVSRAIILERVIPYMSQYRLSDLAEVLSKACLAEAPDIIQFEQLTAFYAAAHAVNSLRKKPTIILDSHNVEHAVLEHAIQSFSAPRKIAGRYLLDNVRQLEDEAAKSADIVLTCCEEDAKYFSAISRKVIIVPNGADCSRFASKPTKLNENILFMGGTNYPPNDEALRWYFDAIYPAVKLQRPNVRHFIIGGTPPKWLKQKATLDAGIILPGYVDDVRDCLDQASICISPMIGGSGTSLKILEYMASAKAVVSTSVGARGIGYSAGVDILIADKSDEFASDILKLMASPNKYREMANNARKLMEREYDWTVIGDQLVKSLNACLPSSLVSEF